MNNKTNLYPIYDYVKEFITKIIVNKDFNEYEDLANKFFTLSKNYNNLNYLLIKNLLSQPIVLNYFNSYEHGRRELNYLFNSNNLNKEFEKYKSKIIESIAFKNPEILKIEKIKQLNDIGILDWDMFKTLFKGRVEANVMKEALGWVVGFVESGDYSLDNTIVRDDNNQIDKKETLLKILNTINKKSLTKEPPFKIENGSITYIPAPSGNLDVLFWCETEQKVYGMCVTRDKRYQIEGNQFIRHNYKLAIIGNEIKKYSHDNPRFLHTPTVRKILESSENKDLRKELDFNFINKQDGKLVDNFYKIDFVKNLMLIRKKIYESTGVLYNGSEISNNEMRDFIKLSNETSKFIFFGEVLNNNDLSEELAGLNLISYKENFEHINPVNLNQETINLFFDNLVTKYNLKSNSNELEKKAKFLIKEIIEQTNISLIELIQKHLGEGYAYKEERSNLFKAIKNLFFTINSEIQENENINVSLNSGLKKFFTEDIKFSKDLIENLKDKNFINNLYNYLDQINKGQAEVQHELKDLKICMELFTKNIEIINYKEKVNSILDNLINNEYNKDELINEIRKLKP